jgi:hypothetical protein
VNGGRIVDLQVKDVSLSDDGESRGSVEVTDGWRISQVIPWRTGGGNVRAFVILVSDPLTVGSEVA